MEQIETLVIGGGQAGIAVSHHLAKFGKPHLVLERGRIAERWRSERWDSLVTNGPAWHDRFPEQEFSELNPDGFAPKEHVAAYFERFAAGLPVRCGVTVRALRQNGNAGFLADTNQGQISARNVVVATGPFQRPLIPDLIPARDGLLQIHSNAYKNPDALPKGAVLVVGAGSSGAQIADELQRAGRKTYLSVGPHDRPPRRYRGKDFVWWLGVLGKWEVKSRTPGTEHITIAVSGAYGGHTMDFRRLADAGVTLLGRTHAYVNGHLEINGDLAKNIAGGDANYLSVLREADTYALKQGLDLPLEPEAHLIGPLPQAALNPIRSLDLAGITSVIWATGYALDFGWIDIDIFNEKGAPKHVDGKTDIDGLYFVGLPFLSHRGSAFIWGAWRDGGAVARLIAQPDPR